MLLTIRCSTTWRRQHWPQRVVANDVIIILCVSNIRVDCRLPSACTHALSTYFGLRSSAIDYTDDGSMLPIYGIQWPWKGRTVRAESGKRMDWQRIPWTIDRKHAGSIYTTCILCRACKSVSVAVLGLSVWGGSGGLGFELGSIQSEQLQVSYYEQIFGSDA